MSVTKNNWSYVYCALVDAKVALRNPFVKEALDSMERAKLEAMLDIIDDAKMRIINQVEIKD